MRSPTIGPLRHRVELQSATTARDAYGREVETWSTYATVWASISNLRGRERWAAQEHHPEIDTSIVIRYRPDVTSAHRVIGPDDTVYRLEAVLDEDGRHRTLELIAQALPDDD